ncbi:MAG: hypothetical protein HQL69_06265 [Magnetococcales bacterium]|nr:hypothetical protein [Magnetococcales bacterium]
MRIFRFTFKCLCHISTNKKYLIIESNNLPGRITMPYTKLLNLESKDTKLDQMPVHNHMQDSGRPRFQNTVVENEKCFVPIGKEEYLHKERLDVELFEMHLLRFTGNG